MGRETVQLDGIPPRLILTARQAADALEVGRPRVYRLAELGALDLLFHLRHRPGRRPGYGRFSMWSIAEYLARPAPRMIANILAGEFGQPVGPPLSVNVASMRRLLGVGPKVIHRWIDEGVLDAMPSVAKGRRVPLLSVLVFAGVPQDVAEAIVRERYTARPLDELLGRPAEWIERGAWRRIRESRVRRHRIMERARQDAEELRQETMKARRRRKAKARRYAGT